MKTTIGRLKGFNPCQPDFDDFVDKLSVIRDCEITDETEVSILEILDLAGVRHAFWSLRTQEYIDYCLILADVAESVLYIFEAKYPEDKKQQLLIQAIRDYKAGKINKEQLRKVAADYTATYATYATYAAYWVYTGTYATYTATNVADRVIAANIARKKQWKINEQILRKHLSAEAEKGE
jgi:hypothetical protein